MPKRFFSPYSRRRSCCAAVLTAASIAVACLVPSALFAGDAEGRFAIKGAGLQECEAFNTAWDEQTRDVALYLGWVDGYVTSFNLTTENTFDLAPWQSSQTLLGMTRLVCGEMGDETGFMAAFDRVVRAILPGRLTSESDVEGLTNGETSVVLYTEVLHRAKRALAEQGYNVDPTHARFTGRTLAAFEAFQRDKELDPSGLPTQRTLIQLLLQ